MYPVASALSMIETVLIGTDRKASVCVSRKEEGSLNALGKAAIIVGSVYMVADPGEKGRLTCDLNDCLLLNAPARNVASRNLP